MRVVKHSEVAAIDIDSDNYNEIFVDGVYAIEKGRQVCKLAFYSSRLGLTEGDAQEHRVVLRVVMPTDVAARILKDFT